MSAVSSIGDALAKFAGLAQPIVDDASAQKYETAFTNRISAIQNVLASPDSDSRANDLSSLTIRLLNDAGYPTSPGLSSNIQIPLSHFIALYTGVAGKIKDDAYLAKYLAKATSS